MSATTKVIRTLALSVHFRTPKLRMKNYEILSRASAFLLAVDPLEETKQQQQHKKTESTSISPYEHLKRNEEERQKKEFKRNYAHEPTGGPPRDVKDLGWLEFCPKDNRPVAHVIASSHVLAPWLWKDYYPQDWIAQVEQEHCAYSLDVICSSKPDKSLAKFALNPYPIHHPENIDLSIIHLKNETAALKHMMDLGVQLLYPREDTEEFQKGETLYFEGFEVKEDSPVDIDGNELSHNNASKSKEQRDDIRSFVPYTAEGSITLFSPTRFLASTPDKSSSSSTDEIINQPLPQGLCGGPVLDAQNRVAGVVEGIVSMDHPETNIAGSAAYIPLYLLKDFVTWAECFMLQQIIPEGLFQKVKDLKDGKNINEIELKASGKNDKTNSGDTLNSFDGTNQDKDSAGNAHRTSKSSNNNITEEEYKTIERDLDDLKAKMSQHLKPEEVKEILAVTGKEQQEVIDILNTEGGDLDEAIERVRKRTLKKQMDIIEHAAKKYGIDINTIDAEIVDDDKDTKK